MQQTRSPKPRGARAEPGAFPEPVGSPEDLENALKFLEKDGQISETSRETVFQAVHSLLGRLRPKPRPRLSDDLARLKKLSDLGLAAQGEIDQLDTVTKGILKEKLGYRSADGVKLLGSNATFQTFFRKFATAVDRSIEQLHADYGHDRGGRARTLSRMTFGDPYEYFMLRLVDIYGRVYGDTRVTATVTSNSANCYNLVDAVHLYARGEPIGREKLFKKVVARHKRPGRRRYPWVA